VGLYVVSAMYASQLMADKAMCHLGKTSVQLCVGFLIVVSFRPSLVFFFKGLV